jgi:hypothetical protein
MFTLDESDTGIGLPRRRSACRSASSLRADGNPGVLINPRSERGERTYMEACFHPRRLLRDRPPKEIYIVGRDINGNEVTRPTRSPPGSSSTS